ncbi:uncharacterized protein B0P05DRAFT_541634 [Gilbertella persicaria]|uniref:uncharacterized protein n=1 Tax=Gilbertella persicaria TaxID=101096 RepID=UPI00221EFAA5|nr:uncharacterized protein B0P05DRAFT_541634 [Gilbertella persicaria]KAI8079695.1 hypothetical protein B0P05DRAFT_541634 [Gilbertella persicaria]
MFSSILKEFVHFIEQLNFLYNTAVLYEHCFIRQKKKVVITFNKSIKFIIRLRPQQPRFQ